VVKRRRQRIRVAAVAHIHADHVEARIPRPRAIPACTASWTSPPARAPGPVRPARRSASLPVAMAQHTAAVRRIHLNLFRFGGNRNGGRGRKLPTIVCRCPFASQRRGSNGVTTPAVRRRRVNLFIFWIFGVTEAHLTRELGLAKARLGENQGTLGRLEGIEPSTS
jgi:hypothetical protein